MDMDMNMDMDSEHGPFWNRFIDFHFDRDFKVGIGTYLGKTLVAVQDNLSCSWKNLFQYFIMLHVL